MRVGKGLVRFDGMNERSDAVNLRTESSLFGPAHLLRSKSVLDAPSPFVAPGF